MVPVNASGVPQPLTLEPPIPGFTVFKAVVIANGTGSVAQLQGVGDMGVDTPALVPLTQELYSFTNVRGAIQVTWQTAGPVPTTPYLVATYSDDPTVDFAGKVYPAALSPMVQVAVSDMFNPVPIIVQSGGGGGVIIAQGGGSATGLDAGNGNVQFTDGGQSTFAYLQSDNESFGFPPDSITLCTFKVIVNYSGVGPMEFQMTVNGLFPSQNKDEILFPSGGDFTLPLQISGNVDPNQGEITCNYTDSSSPLCTIVDGYWWFVTFQGASL